MSTWEADADRLHGTGARHALILSKTPSALGQLAEGIARALAPRQMQITSAAAVRGPVDPVAARVLAELSVTDVDTHAKTLAEIDASGVGAILVVSEEDPTPPALRHVVRAHWPLPDPAAGGGTAEEKLARYRAVRNELRRRLIRVFARDLGAHAAAAGTTISIAPAAGGDFEAIPRLLTSALLPSRDVGLPGQRFIVASEASRILGCAGLQVAGEDGLVRSMTVHWTRRNAGLGSRLLDRLLLEAVLVGVRTLYVVTTTAEDFFARHGFRKIPADEVPAELRSSEEFTAFVAGGSAVMARPVERA